jgi:hypothetical protein
MWLDPREGRSFDDHLRLQLLRGSEAPSFCRSDVAATLSGVRLCLKKPMSAIP